MFRLVYVDSHGVVEMTLPDAEELHRHLRALASCRTAEVLEVAAA